jgi:hypothetical protein
MPFFRNSLLAQHNRKPSPYVPLRTTYVQLGHFLQEVAKLQLREMPSARSEVICISVSDERETHSNRWPGAALTKISSLREAPWRAATLRHLFRAERWTRRATFAGSTSESSLKPKRLKSSKPFDRLRPCQKIANWLDRSYDVTGRLPRSLVGSL